MVDLATSVRSEKEQSPFPQRPPLRPAWLHPVLAGAIVFVHIAFFASGIYWPAPQVADLATIDAELIPEGDSLDAGDPAPEGDTLDVSALENAPAVAVEEPEAALPPPPIMQPEAAAEPSPDAPARKEEKPKAPEKKRASRAASADAKSREASPDKRRYGVPGGAGQGAGTAQVAGRFGLPGGRAQGSAATQAACLVQVATSIRRHLPGATSLGPGTAYVTFYVNPGGGISGISVSASSPAHEALARRIVGASRGPGNCASAYASQHITFQ
jgi:outer membrane biosynthesis protein TonB